jgi:hypothetical protein
MLEIVNADFGAIVDGCGRAVVEVGVGDPPLIIRDVKVVLDNDFAKCSVQAPDCVSFTNVFDQASFAVGTFAALARFGMKHRLFDPHPAPQSAAEVQ